MSISIVLVVVAAFVILRVVRSRSRRQGSMDHKPANFGPFSGDVALVASREIRERVRARAFQIGTVIILAVIAGAIVIPTLTASKQQVQYVGVVGQATPALITTIHAASKSVGAAVMVLPGLDRQAADDALASGRIDLAVIDGEAILVKTPVAATDTSTTAQVVDALAQALGIVKAEQAAHLTSGQISALEETRPLPIQSLQSSGIGGRAHKSANGVSIIGLILVFMLLSQYDGWILLGVMEEKSSRVVEVLLGTVPPLHLLAGKVLGIGLVAFAQASAAVVFALALADAIGSNLLHGTAPVVLVSTLVWLVLGYAFYCWVFAAAGSTSERQDQAQSLAVPLTLPIVFGYVMALIAASSGSASEFFKVLAYLPPTAPFAMPVLVGLGEVSWWQFAASVVISIICTIGVARFAANIYRKAILRTGSRVRLREVVRRTRG